MIKLIVNADDFGYSPLFNETILDLLEKRIISSTTVMVDHIDSRQTDQVAALKTHPGVGLHMIGDVSFESQYNRFLEIFERPPTHLDIHKRIDDIPLIQELNRFAERKSLPCRNMGVRGNTKQTTFPVFFSTYLSFRSIRDYVDDMAAPHSYEILTHPGIFDPGAKTSLNKEREVDHQLMLQLHDYLQTKPEIQLVHFGEL
jgi:predicted glycoside hydrolase/deacetylase ChbG (UPF0249 family)